MNEDVNQYVFVWDRAKSHYLTAIKKLRTDYLNVMFRPTASPDIMPIELAFSKWKYNIRRMELETED